MFSSSGKIVKVLAIISFIAGVIAAIVGAIMLFSYETYSYSRYSYNTRAEHPYIGLGFVVLFAGPFVSWLQANILYALGEATDSGKRANEKIEELKVAIQTMSKPVEETPSSVPDSAAAIAPVDPQPLIPEEIDVFQPVPSGMWRCLTCGTVNSENDGICKKCGTFKSSLPEQN